ncbi:MAG: hypothetical protein MZU97_06930 [Bacillus subtilis]|nr:hypothetical protein [Bacillus subtilis]
MKEKYDAVVDEIERRHEQRPAGAGRHDLGRESASCSRALLERRGIKHDVLNAKQHEREAEIVAQAGQRGAGHHRHQHGRPRHRHQARRRRRRTRRPRTSSAPNATSRAASTTSCAAAAGRQGDPGYSPLLPVAPRTT